MGTRLLAELRMQVADRDRDLRNAKDDYEIVKARRTAAAQPNGKNKEERDTQIACFLADDGEYQASLALLRHAEWQRDRALADLESAKDIRREWEWNIRLQLAGALAGRNVQSDAAQPADDSAFDDTMDHYTYAATQGYQYPIDPHSDDLDF